MENPEFLSRKAARTLGRKTYFTGIPCKHNHIDVRSVANAVCFQCRRDSQNAHRLKDPAKERQRSKDWYAANKEHAAQWKSDWIAANPDAYKARRQKYRSKTETRAKEMLAAARRSCKVKKLPFDLDVDWIFERLEIGRCELTNLPFNLAPEPGGRQNPYTASLDRIKPEAGYVRSNVRVILWALNAAFNTYGEGVYADIARVYLARHPASTGLT